MPRAAVALNVSTLILNCKIIISAIISLGVPAFAKDQCMHIPSNLKFDHFKGGTEV